MISVIIPLLAGQCAIAFQGTADTYLDAWGHPQVYAGRQFDSFGWLPPMVNNIEEFIVLLTAGESAMINLDGKIFWAVPTEPGACAPVPKFKPSLTLNDSVIENN